MTNSLEGALTIDDSAVAWNVDERARAEALRSRPLLVLMHGFGSNERDLLPIARSLPAEFVIASLRAPARAGNGFAWFPLGEPGNPVIEAVDVPALAVLAWLDRVVEGYGALSTVVPMGFSQGGAMALHLLRHAPDRFAAAVNLSGFIVNGDLPGDGPLAKSRPAVFWGRDVQDPVITTAAVDRTRQWLSTHSTVSKHHYAGIFHSVSGDEISDVNEFLEGVLEARQR